MTPTTLFLSKIRKEDEILREQAQVVFEKCEKSWSLSSNSSKRALETDRRLTVTIAESKTTIARYVDAQTKFNDLCLSKLHASLSGGRKGELLQPRAVKGSPNNVRINLD